MDYSLVTGACGGIGKEFCRLLVSKGENLILIGRNEDKLESLKAELLLINPSVSILTKEADCGDRYEKGVCIVHGRKVT